MYGARTIPLGAATMLTKPQLISSIQAINNSARKEWLATFEVSALNQYLDHLQITLEPRGGASRWVRDVDSPVIVTRRPVI